MPCVGDVEEIAGSKCIAQTVRRRSVGHDDRKSRHGSGPPRAKACLGAGGPGIGELEWDVICRWRLVGRG